jgi:hypothetical protein
MARVSCSIRASSDMGENNDAATAADDDDAVDIGAASMTVRAELTAITLPSIPTLRANDSMKMLRMRSFMMLVLNTARDACSGGGADDDGDDDAGSDGGGVDRITKSPSAIEDSDATDAPGDATTLLPLMLAACSANAEFTAVTSHWHIPSYTTDTIVFSTPWACVKALEP